MKSEELLKSMGNVDDKFIEESSSKPERKTLVITLPRAKTVYKWGGAVAAVLAVCVIGTALLSGFGGARKSASFDMDMISKSESYDSNSGYYSVKESDYSYSPSENFYFDKGLNEDYAYSSSLVQNSVTSLGKENLKLIYTANMSVQTTDYTAAETEIKDLVDKLDGYFESVSYSNGSYYSDSSYRSGKYSIRVPAENYTAFIDGLGENCHVVSLSQSVQDVGESYYEIEGRLQTLYTKQERLQALLKEAANMTDIIELESALSDTEYQIDSYKGQLNHYDSLIGYSTVSLTLEQVVRPSSGIEEDTSFGARIARSFKRGLSNAADNFEDFVIWFSGNIIGIVIVLVVIILLIKFRPVRKLWRKIRKKD